MPPRLIVSLKAFGDFVIACNCLCRVKKLPLGWSDLTLVAGEHLRDLAAALEIETRVWWLASGAEVPAAFDVRRRGIPSALVSLNRLRRGMRALPDGCELIFDRLSWREHFIGASYPRSEFLPSPNIYLAIEETLRSRGVSMNEEMPTVHLSNNLHSRKLARVFPASRLARKSIPAHVLSRLTSQLSASGVRCEVIALGNENLCVPDGINVTRIERTFTSLIASIKSSDLVVGADSLPVHLAEYFGVRAYVVSPAPNEYWLPKSSYTDAAWCLFDDEQSLVSWLSKSTNSADHGGQLRSNGWVAEMDATI